MLVQGISEKSQKILNIMHNYAFRICILCIFLKMHKNHFFGHFRFFHLKFFFGLVKILEFMHILCFLENELIAPILLWDGCYWFTKYGR